MHTKRLAVLLATPLAAVATLLPWSAGSQAFAATSTPTTTATALAPTQTPYDQGYKDGYAQGLKYARDCVRADPRGRSGVSGKSAEYNRGYIAGIIAAYRYVHRTYCGFAPNQ
ncbi:hypothetical protein ACWGQ5_31590 [Streptomyces sp. NPDC055722]